MGELIRYPSPGRLPDGHALTWRTCQWGGRNADRCQRAAAHVVQVSSGRLRLRCDLHMNELPNNPSANCTCIDNRDGRHRHSGLGCLVVGCGCRATR
jgi:hypothetical protein